MDVPRSDLLLLVLLVAATPARGQGLAPAFPPANSSAIQSAASIPDFSGIWAHLTWPDFEPPPAGPGLVTNRSRRNGVSDVFELVGDYTNPILKPQAAEVVKRLGEVSLIRCPIRPRATSVGPEGYRSFFSISGCRCSSSRTKLRFSIPTIMKSATFA
jgi:hypothetical protein